jgi:hypothetical protein
MKKIIKPSEPEEAVYYSDFKGTCFNNMEPDIEIKIEFNYGSKYDGSQLKLHLTDDEFDVILKTIKENVSNEFKKTIKNFINQSEKDFDDSMQCRDWLNCEYSLNNTELLRKILK